MLCQAVKSEKMNMATAEVILSLQIFSSSESPSYLEHCVEIFFATMRQYNAINRCPQVGVESSCLVDLKNANITDKNG